MAHNIEFNELTQKHSFVSVKEKPWHALGQIIDHRMTAKEVIELANLDFEVEKIQAKIELGGKIIDIPNTFATYRTDRGICLTKSGKTVSGDYEVLQNKDAFTFFDAIVDEEEAIYETAGVLGDGETIFITAKLPSYINIPGDAVESYILLTSSHNGLGSVQATFTPIRVVCNNTLSAALNKARNSASSHRVSIRHSMNIKENLENAHKLMGIMTSLQSELAEVYQAMTKKRLSDSEFKKFIHSVVLNAQEMEDVYERKGTIQDIISTRKMNILNDIYEYAEVGAGQQLETAKGTLWGAYNALTGYYQNVKEYKSEEKKVRSLIQGGYSYMLDNSLKNALVVL